MVKCTEMKKKFDDWNLLKQSLHAKAAFPTPKRRQVWWCTIGQNIGSEQSCEDGYDRPVLVVKTFGSMFWGLPITSSDPTRKKHENTDLYYELDGHAYVNDKGDPKTLTGFIAFHQMRIFDSRRLKRKILRFDEPLFEAILKRLRRLI